MNHARPKITKFISILFIVLILLQATLIEASGNPLTVYIDTEKVAFDVPPQIINGRTMVPLRVLAENLYSNIRWIPETKSVKIQNAQNLITLKVNDPIGTINGKAVAFDTKPVIINSRVLVPLRFIAESYGATINWNANTKTVDLQSKEWPLPGSDLVERYAQIDQNYYENVIKNMEDFQLLHEWTGNASITSKGDYQSNVQRLAAAKPLGDYFYLRLNIPSEQNLHWCSVYLSETLDFKNYFTCDLTQKILHAKEEFILNRNEFITSAGSPNWNDIKYVKIAFESNPDSQFTITPLSFSTYSPTALCTVWFDDGWLDNYTNAFEIINSIDENIDAEVSIIPKNIGQEHYMNRDQIAELIRSGWGICNHTFNHLRLADIPLQAAQKEIEEGVHYLYPIAGGSALNLAVPYSSVNNSVLDIAKEASTSCRYAPEKYNVIPTDRFNIAYKEVTDTTDFETVASWIDESMVNHYWLVLLFHKVDDPVTADTMVSKETFRKIVYYLYENRQNIRTVTTSEALSSMGYSED